MTAKTRHVKARAGVTSKRTTSPVPGHDGSWRGPGLLKIRDVSLFVDVIGHGYPLLLMHGGPSLDHWSLMPFRQCAGQFTLIFYDHRCNGRSAGAPVSSMTLENLTADAEALRQELGIERWAVLGHSFGGHVALEYALRYPASLSHLVLLDTGGDAHWARQNAPDVLASRGYSPKKVELVRRWFTGELTPHEYVPMAMRIAGAYSHSTLRLTARGALEGGWRTRYRPQAFIFAGRHLLKDWTVMDRLGQITVPTLVLAGRDDFIFPPECQRELAAGIPHARLQIIDRAGHNPHAEQTAEVMAAVRHFLSADTPTA
jgi:pimeloyl-ACP methyl ester carboxylesterase